MISSYFQLFLTIFLTWIHLGSIRQFGQHLIESSVHLLGSSFEKTTASCDEEGVSSEDDTRIQRIRRIRDVVADVARGVARGRQTVDLQRKIQKQNECIEKKIKKEISF